MGSLWSPSPASRSSTDRSSKPTAKSSAGQRYDTTQPVHLDVILYFAFKFPSCEAHSTSLFLLLTSSISCYAAGIDRLSLFIVYF